MHPTIGYDLAKAHVADLRHQAQREARAHTTRRAPVRQNVPGAQHPAVFASTLQRSDAPAADMAAETIAATAREFDAEGCIYLMAQVEADQ